MEKLPSPPARFTIPAITRDCRRGERLWRIYFMGGDHPTRWNELRHFGPTGSRFDHHTRPKRMQPRGILYATMGSHAILTALAEVFQEQRHIDRRRAEPWLAGFDLAHAVSLLDTGGAWPGRAGGSMALNSGSRSRAREWSRGIYTSYPAVEGILYPSSLKNQPCVALYERAENVLPVSPIFNERLDSPKLIDGLTLLAKELHYTMS